jgi:hypothetical protein
MVKKDIPMLMRPTKGTYGALSKGQGEFQRAKMFQEIKFHYHMGIKILLKSLKLERK